MSDRSATPPFPPSDVLTPEEVEFYQHPNGRAWGFFAPRLASTSRPALGFASVEDGPEPP